ncbi:MAG: ABC transporter ATP-binding protein [Eubacteriales bacterium]
MEQLKWLYQCIGKRKIWFFLALSLGVITAGLYLFFPFITREITSMLPADREPSQLELELIYAKLPLLLGILVGSQLLRSGLRYVMLISLEHTSQNTMEEIRLSIYENLCRQDDEFYHNNRQGDLMTRLTGDIDLLRHTIAWLSYNIVESITLFGFSILYFFSINHTMAWATLLLTPLIFISSFFYSKSVLPYYKRLREKLATMNSVTQENIAGNKTVRAFVREDYEIERFTLVNEEYREANLQANRHWMKFFPLIEGFSQTFTVFTVAIGGTLIIQGTMNLADLAAFTLLSWGITEPMKNLGVYLNDYQRFLASTTKVMELYYAKEQIKNPVGGVTNSPEHGTIRFDNVSMQFHDGKTATLEDISFSINFGETLGLIGVTGSGKTTLINLITRSVDATAGIVYVDGIDVQKWDLQELRSRVSEATQKVGLHSESVRNNIAYGCPDLSISEIRQSAQFAAAHFVEELPSQYDTIIGEMGMGLSGGQKQRIALARALAKKSEILILDDTTSAVDTETERELRENLKNLPYTCTKVIVAQRISAVREADLILVLDRGRVVQRGKHQELSTTEGFYREICQLQGVE